MNEDGVHYLHSGSCMYAMIFFLVIFLGLISPRGRICFSPMLRDHGLWTIFCGGRSTVMRTRIHSHLVSSSGWKSCVLHAKLLLVSAWGGLLFIWCSFVPVPWSCIACVERDVWNMFRVLVLFWLYALSGQVWKNVNVNLTGLNMSLCCARFITYPLTMVTISCSCLFESCKYLRKRDLREIQKSFKHKFVSAMVKQVLPQAVLFIKQRS